MKHLGDITKIDGHTVPVVDCIIGGSPCQDLSIAGQRAGLAGERSGLFMEQIRIVREMREEDKKRGKTANLIRPRFCVWENVPGALSSNGGKDFQAVLTEFIRIAEPDAPDVPLPAKGKWPLADAYYGDGWSVAYRVHDAQFWGVPQRRRRIALVADFGGHAAPEVLFERQGLRGDFAESGTAGEGAAAAAGTGAETADNGGTDYLTGWDCQEKRVFTPKGVAHTLAGSDDGSGRTGCGYVFCIQGNCIDRADTAGCHGKGWKTDVSYTLNTIDRPAVVYAMATGRANAEILTGQSPTLNCNHEQTIVLVYDARGNGDGVTVPTLTGDHENRVTDYTALVLAFKYHQGAGARGLGEKEEVAPSLCADGGHPPAILLTYPDKVSHSLLAKGQLSHRADEDTLILSCAEDGTILLDGKPCTVVRMQVRRLTPLEAERLQGYPDGWTDIGPWVDSKGKLHKESSDSARYKALGNSIALPFWKWLLKRISAQYERDATMASLFDGISGFVCLWKEINGWDSVKWTSEIDDFATAVCKKHFGDEETGERGDFYEVFFGRNKGKDV